MTADRSIVKLLCDSFLAAAAPEVMRAVGLGLLGALCTSAGTTTGGQPQTAAAGQPGQVLSPSR